MNIIREIYTTKNIRIEPISTVYGSSAIIWELALMDYEIPDGATAVAYVKSEDNDRYRQNCAIFGNSVKFNPADGLFTPGKNELQVEIEHNGRSLITFGIDVLCEEAIAAGDSVSPQPIRTYAERAEAAAAHADDVAASIPADYSQLQADVNNIARGYARPAIISNSYVETDGSIKSYNAWKRTDYVECPETGFFIIDNTVKASIYNAFYDSNKNPLPSPSFSVPLGTDTIIEIPRSAKYAIFSNTNDGIGGLRIRSEQATINRKTLDASELSELYSQIEIPKSQLLQGYINASGAFVSNAQFLSTDFVPIKSYGGTKVIISCEVVDAHCVCFYDDEKRAVKSYSEQDYPRRQVDKYVFEIPNGSAYVRFGYEASQALDVSVVKQFDMGNLIADVGKLVEGRYEDISNDVSHVDGSYISVSGSTPSLSSYSHTENIELLKGEKLYVTANVISSGAVAYLSKWTKDGKFIETLVVSTDEQPQIAAYEATEDVEYIRVSYINNRSPYYRPVILRKNATFAQLREQTKTNSEEIAVLKPNKELATNFWSYAMWKVLCIGDSLTSGASYREEWGEIAWPGASLDENMPRILGRMLGAEVDNGGFSGYSASTWYNAQQDGTINSNRPYDFSKYDTFFIWLGTNNGLTDTLDSDVNRYSDYHNFANTETGYYCKLIEDIKAHNSDCLIVLVKVFASKGDYEVTNRVIDKIATKYNLPVIDNSDLGTSQHIELHAGVYNPHFGKAGNIFIANRFITEMGKYFAENPLRCEYGYTPRTN